MCTRSMKGKVVAVSGAAAGIGFAAAEAMAEAGADVALWYNSNDAAIQKGEALAQRTGVRVKAYKVGVTDLQEVKQAVEQVVRDFGKLDVAVSMNSCSCLAFLREYCVLNSTTSLRRSPMLASALQVASSNRHRNNSTNR